ncbi:MAG: hypothetical protein CVT99_05585 [Bacteroidetes bacterium HGW-Bacteroidetes-16]|nr:MAG: hypothetical protein CVT99_05585 [Bacteroidetes bacterium HGW-Bacteroidetes-16]
MNFHNNTKLQTLIPENVISFWKYFTSFTHYLRPRQWLSFPFYIGAQKSNYSVIPVRHFLISFSNF